jgi:hypothetical protein
MQYDAIAAELTRLDYRWLLRVRALCTARRRCVLKGGMAATWPAAQSSTDREVGKGGAQRLLPRGGHVGAVLNVEVGESCEAS